MKEFIEFRGTLTTKEFIEFSKESKRIQADVTHMMRVCEGSSFPMAMPKQRNMLQKFIEIFR